MCDGLLLLALLHEKASERLVSGGEFRLKV